MSRSASRSTKKKKFEVAIAPSDTTYSITWVIRSFCNDVCEPGMCHLSPLFPSGENSHSQWQLKLYPNGRKQRCVIFLHLMLMSSISDKMFVDYKVKIINTRFSHLLPESRSGQYLADKKKQKNTEYTIMAVNVLPRWKELITGGAVTFNVEVDAKPVFYDTPVITERLTALNAVHDVDMDLKSNFPDDIKFIVKEEVFFCNKELLAYHSPVFEAMFQHDMREVKENKVVINDCEPDVFNDFIFFINNSHVKNDANIKDLLQIADKYDIVKLKDICEYTLSLTLNVENAADMFVVADKFNAKKLRCIVLKFIVSCVKSVLKTAGYQSMQETQPSLCCEIFNGVVYPQNLFKEPYI